MPEIKPPVKLKLGKRSWSASPFYEIYRADQYKIAKYASRCPITGEPTKDYFYMIFDLNNFPVDNISYDSYDLCLRVLNANAMNNKDLMDKVVSEFNSMLRELNEKGDDADEVSDRY